MKTKLSIFWFRRDLRLEDNAGFCQAMASGFPVLPIFIFDTAILDALENKSDKRVDYIHQALSAINLALKNYHSCNGSPAIFSIASKSVASRSAIGLPK